MNQLREKHTVFEKEMSDVKARLGVGGSRAPTNAWANKIDIDTETQVIFGGLETGEDENAVIAQIKAVLDGMGMQEKYANIKTNDDPAKIGIVQFRSKASKLGFYKKANTIQATWNCGETMWWKNNDTIEKRLLDAELGFIKYHLIETKGFSPSDVKILWKKPSKPIEVKESKVAWISNDNSFIEKTGVASEIKELVENSMKEWKNKRNIE